MESMTNLRMLRFRHHIPLASLAACSGLSKQYISRAELGEIPAAARLDAQMSSAMESVISIRKARLQALEADYLAYKGRLLRKEIYPNEP